VRRFALIGAVALLAACGGGDDSTLGKAETAMAELDAGTMTVELSATTDDVQAPVGFRVDGSFSFTEDGELPLLDFDYTQLLAGEEDVATITSDGTTVWVDAGGQVVELTEEQSASLRLGDDEGFADLGIASWVEDPEEETSGSETVVRGTVDAADLLGDLARIASQVGGSEDVGPLDGDAAERLAGLVRSSDIEVVIGEDDLPRSVDATIDFGAEVPDELTEALGPYAAARLHLVVELARLDGELTIEPPR
jgi:hypothetical protein